MDTNTLCEKLIRRDVTITPVKQKTMPQYLHSLTDEMFVTEAPSFIVPYIYEKPAKIPFKKFFESLGEELISPQKGRKSNDIENTISANYFDSELGKFFLNIGLDLVQEHIIKDIEQIKNKKYYKTTEAKPPFERNNNKNNKTIVKKCSFCSFRTESMLVMAHHLEIPHMKNKLYMCNFCPLETRSPRDILWHMSKVHMTRARLEKAPAPYPCANCPCDVSKSNLLRHQLSCAKSFNPNLNLAPNVDWEPPAQIVKLQLASNNITLKNKGQFQKSKESKMSSMTMGLSNPTPIGPQHHAHPINTINTINLVTTHNHQKPATITSRPIPQTPFVVCEICDGYISNLNQLRFHMDLIHKIKIHPKVINSRPPLKCQKCEYRCFSDQGLEKHLLDIHNLFTSSMQEDASNGKDAGKCPHCGKMFMRMLLLHISNAHNIVLKPAHLSYKCTVCGASFHKYKNFETHVYAEHNNSRVANGVNKR